MPRGKRTNSQPARLQEALVLHKYILNLFGCKDLEALSRDLKDPALEGVDDEGTSRFYYVLKLHMYDLHISQEKLLEYDQNIVRHTKEINERRREKIQWKYYQYLALLFTEVYLDCYFSDKEKLLQEINDFLINQFNFRPETWHGIKEFTEEDLNKIAFWCATGSGKTLMMHVNIKQYLYYAQKNDEKKLNRIIILTPNEGLSKQHLEEFLQSNFEAHLFSKNIDSGIFNAQGIDIIDINKLADKDGDKTVAVESFEGNNLVLVDEGHRGSSGEQWRKYRSILTSQGFSFEYSATFGQAIASQTGSNRNALLNEYGKATLFDYSYRYFYNDGYGKDYRIMNMDVKEWNDNESLEMYLTAYLLCLYEQTLVYESSPLVKSRFLIARPLGIFVGHSVNKTKSISSLSQDDKATLSDVVKILLFLRDFIEKKEIYSIYIKRLLDPADGINNARGYSLFANAFRLIKTGLKPDEEMHHARLVYDNLKKTLFHCETVSTNFQLIKQKGGNEEIGLQIGSNDFFGVINVGDSASLLSLCEKNDFKTDTREFGNIKLFDTINEEDSKINILIGSKKFSEGWSSWRVSVMGLMNVGRSEGSEIIQLFGRGVRLKGFKMSLKRSAALDASYNPGRLPKCLKEIETLNIFGICADYMAAFRQYLEDEGLPANEDVYETIQIPTVNLLPDNCLKLVRLKKGYDFKKAVVVNPQELKDSVFVKVDWTYKVDVLWSNGTSFGIGVETGIHYLKEAHLQLLNWNKIFFNIEQMKNERGWYNMEISVELLQSLMNYRQWYELTIPEGALEFHDFGKDVRRWEEITIALLRAYIERAYKRSKGKWESKYMETVYINRNDPNFFDEYTVEVRRDKQDWIERLLELKESIDSRSLADDFAIEAPWIQALRFDRHLYYPLLCLTEKDRYGNRVLLDEDTNEPLIKISPVALNVGESAFVKQIRAYYTKHKDESLKGKEFYLLRNESRKGIGFFEANNFYPDFILWVTDGNKQHVVFIDPKGIRNLRGIEDPKIQLYRLLKNEIQPSLNDANITLDSYIVSNTDYEEVSFMGTRQEFLDNHVLFKEEDNYLDVLFELINL